MGRCPIGFADSPEYFSQEETAGSGFDGGSGGALTLKAVKVNAGLTGGQVVRWSGSEGALAAATRAVLCWAVRVKPQVAALGR